MINNQGFYFLWEKERGYHSRGINIYPKQKLKMLYAYPDISEAAVISVEDEKYG